MKKVICSILCLAVIMGCFIFPQTDVEAYPTNWGNYSIDYVNVFYHNNINNYDSFWMKNTHYKIVDVGNTSYIEILNNQFNDGDKLFITGIKLANNNREFK